ncbi:MAG: DUF4276 family protein, partial [Terracidiphilus sp.]
MSVRIYVEGGGDNKDTLKRCNEGFALYCGKLAPESRRPRIVACGGRRQAYDRFHTAIGTCEKGDVCALLVDAEAPATSATAAQHLRDQEGWAFSARGGHKAFLMVQAMEAWFLADREALNDFYDGGFLAGSLPGNPTDIEPVRKEDLEPSLKHASAPTKSKGEYHKGKHGFALLALS